MADDQDMNEESKLIPEVFKDCIVLITGATGFVGKVLLEKLLRCCREVKQIYVVLRSTPIEGPKERLEKLLSNTAFNRVRNECPTSLSKVVAFGGDVCSPNLGMSDEDIKLLQDDEAFVFHCAATVRFDEDFRTSVQSNLIGTKNVMELCGQMKHLKALVHVSTAYSFCNWKNINEVVFPERAPPKEVISMSEWMTDDQLDVILPYLRNQRPSNYHYTKAMAEVMLVKERGDLPLAIVRPSIVTAAWKDPYPGWTDTYNGPSGLIAACGKGVVRSLWAHRKVAADFIPVDIVANTLIVAAWHTATKRPKLATIVNCTSGSLNKLTWGQVESICLPLLPIYPSMDLFRYPGGSFKSSEFENNICLLFNHMMPAYVIDAFAWITRRQPRMVKLYKRIHRVIFTLEYFTTQQWIFYCQNYLKLINSMSQEDKEIFPIDIRSVNWNDYLEDYVKGVRKFLLREEDSTLPAARKKMMMVYYKWQGLRLTMFIGLLWLLKVHKLPFLLYPLTLASGTVPKLQALRDRIFSYSILQRKI